MKANVFVECRNILGESPMWNKCRETFMWVDIDAQTLYECDEEGDSIKKWTLDQKVSLVLEADKTSVFLAVQSGLSKLDLLTGKLTQLLDIEKENTLTRTNDGAVDALGRLWLGTMALDCAEGLGNLYAIEPLFKMEIKIPKTTISNGIAWNIENTIMYYIDSASYAVKSYQYNLEDGKIIFLKDVINISPELGMPDGMVIDVEGMLWVAVWGGKGVFRFNPDNGQLIDKIEVEAPHVTSCAFGGKNMDRLIITTAAKGLSKENSIKFPNSGNLFIVKTEVKGVQKNIFSVAVNQKSQ